MSSAPEYIEIDVKSALNRLKFVDSWFWCRYTLNSYRGCEHSCIYCDSRSKKYYLHSDLFETIYVKRNLGRILEKELKSKKKEHKDVIAFGASSDIYQPAEARYRITEKCLEVINKYRYPLSISTKSVLIGRDLELLDNIGKNSYCAVAFSISTISDEIAARVEPYAAPPSERLKLLERIKKDFPNIVAGVNLIPIIPYLEDARDDLVKLVRKVADIGADFLLFSPGLTLRDIQADYFFDRMKEISLEIALKIADLYGLGDGLGGNRGKTRKSRLNSYLDNLNNFIYENAQKYEISVRMPRWIPKDYRKMAYIVSEEILNDVYLSKFNKRSRDSFKEKYGAPPGSMMWSALILQNLKAPLETLIGENKLEKVLLDEFNKRKWRIKEQTLGSVVKAIKSVIDTKFDKNAEIKSGSGLDRFLN